MKKLLLCSLFIITKVFAQSVELKPGSGGFVQFPAINSLPICTVPDKGKVIFYTSDNSLRMCNGTAWINIYPSDALALPLNLETEISQPALRITNYDSGNSSAILARTYSSAQGNAIWGIASNQNPSADNNAVFGYNLSSNNFGSGVFGNHDGGGNGVSGTSNSGNGVKASSYSGVGLSAFSNSGTALMATSTSGTAGYFYSQSAKAIETSGPIRIGGLGVGEKQAGKFLKSINSDGDAEWRDALPIDHTTNSTQTSLRIMNTDTLQSNVITLVASTNSKIGGTAISAHALKKNPTFPTIALKAHNSSSNNFGMGIKGSHEGGGTGIYGESLSGNGLSGYSFSGSAGYFESFEGNALITGLGKIGLGTSNPTKAYLVVDKKIGATHAIFGENTSGVAIESEFPGFSFNGYWNSGRKPLVNGYVGGMGMNPSTGLITIYNSSASGTTGVNITTQDILSMDNNGFVGVGRVPSYKLDVNGNIRVNSTVYTSDLRFKKDILDLPPTLAKVALLQAVSYHFDTKKYADRNFPLERQIGFIAQDLEKVFPEMVTTDNEGFKAVDYAKLTPILVEAIQELKAENEALKIQHKKLEVSSEKLLYRLEAIEASLNPNSSNVRK